ncbi:MAG: asparagine synthase (glutamine-hydrolyzing) [Rhodospirillales bacterium]
MCGIAGVFSPRARLDLRDAALRMAETLTHRGPDASGIWADADAGIALGHTRLSIVDLSPAGSQPMTSSCGRFVISYNGEVYNAQDIRKELGDAGHISFRGHSDTEVILEAFARWGVPKTLKRMVGMFAFALWDKADRSLTLARDRLGIKPLYWGHAGEALLFGSELKALAAFSGFTKQVDRNALAAYLRLNYVPAPLSIFEGVHKLEPGCLLRLTAGGAPTIERYWDMREVARSGQQSTRSMDDADAVDEADRLIRDAVRLRMVADVPLGAFLSGGIDSSTVVALMQAQSTRSVKTFSIGFSEASFNEAQHASAVARHLGTDHTEFYVSPEDAQQVIPLLPDMFDEPFGDSSEIPTHLISRLTRAQVTVALTGDGGDEVFCGYTRYVWGDFLNRYTSPIPQCLRTGAARMLRGLREEQWDALLSPLPNRWLPSHPGEKVWKMADVLSQPDGMALYRRLVTAWEDPGSLVPGSREPRTVIWDASVADDAPAFMERMQLLDTLTYLPEDILTKVDRASMAVSLEARVPLLDHRLVEFAWSLPRAMRVRGKQGKWLLRQVLNRYVPTALTDRAKMGFGIPVGQWLRGPLRDWAEDLLQEDRLAEGDLLRPEAIREAWSMHLSGRRNLTTELWTVLMFQSWRRRWAV